MTSSIKPANFVHQIDNPYYPLKPGTTLIYKSPDGSEVVRTAVTHQTKEILGVSCVVVLDKSYINGKLAERTLDYFAQDKHGNVWYFGEAAKNFHNGHFLNTDGSWLAGVNGAQPGIIMEGSPNVGDRYNQENAAGIAEDRAKIINLEATKNVPFATFQHLLVTAETTPLEPGFLERKYYAPGIGQVLAIDLTTGDQEQLVKIIHHSPAAHAHNARIASDASHARHGEAHSAPPSQVAADSFDFSGLTTAVARSHAANLAHHDRGHATLEHNGLDHDSGVDGLHGGTEDPGSAHAHSLESFLGHSQLFDL